MPTFTIRTKQQASTEHLSLPTTESIHPRKPEGQPGKGMVWCETTHNWIGDGLKSASSSPSPSTKPGGQPPNGKVWCFRTNEWISKPKVRFVKRIGSNGKTKYVMTFHKPSSSKAPTKCTRNVTISNPSSTCSTQRPTKVQHTCSTQLNKFIHKQLMAGKVTGVEDALRKGGSLAYFNFDGICSAAENGKIAIFQMIFEKLDYTRLIDKALGVDLCETAEEEGHNTLATYLRGKLENLLDKIENENLDGLDNYV